MPDPRFALGDTVIYLPTGWRYVIAGVDADTYQLEALEDAPNVWPWVSADKLRRCGS